ncbi:MAG: RecQ family ATP-dependent DNA helicase [Verrucomicrobia bacterium]|nr:MAG: RecQ family ATP-dependent DNA helicase [Verrucomicrobiota bacterium]TAE88521.1 MAG: RecQ family ATP-dependent DNA helicase [Verrucomicrobiota bacterium]TAF26976.1 MAG: RecQ family ATP-dependent DNA helicase [Verrucomicrobiota bacterium]TAF42232.1 MAG: RecQ family ATP-dependent DNA helicase [Verrucomicrobiota bacterium]
MGGACDGPGGIGKRNEGGDDRALAPGTTARLCSGVPDDSLTELLRERFGHDGFRGGQRAVVDGLLDGRSMLAVFPTGGGKSLCYQLPALLLDGITLVVSPLIALMKDQVDALRAKGIAAARLDSTLAREDYEQVMAALDDASLKLLYVAPERLSNEGFRARLKKLRIALVAIDEAHCISEWGHNFRPDYLKLAKLCRDLKVPRVLCLTATATPSVAKDIRRGFRIAAADEIRLSFHRPNLDLKVSPLAAAERKPHLLARLRESEGAAVVYVTLQHTAEEVATYLQKHGIAARAYHAGLPDEFRASAQEDFMAGRTRVIVATIAFGMGIDKSDIRAVYHYNLPKSLENYTQETGRAGRDGALSSCELLACGDDLVTLENFIHGDTPSPTATRHFVDHVLRLGRDFDISPYELSTVNDIRPLVISTLLTYLELEGVIEATRMFWATYQVKLLRDFERVLAGYDARRKAFLRKIFAAAKDGWSWKNFSIADVAAQTGEDPTKIVTALTWLEEAGDVVLKKSGIRQGYRIRKDPGDLRELAERLDVQFRRRESADLERLAEVVELAGQKRCLTGFVTAHFGEKLAAPCGHCDRCRGVAPSPLPRTRQPDPSQDELRAIRALRDEGHAALKTPRQLARFLCGIGSPAVTRARLSRHDAFGLLERLPFAAVLDLAESC